MHGNNSLSPNIQALEHYYYLYKCTYHKPCIPHPTTESGMKHDLCCQNKKTKDIELKSKFEVYYLLIFLLYFCYLSINLVIF